MTHARLHIQISALLVLFLATAACVSSFNGPVDVPAGSSLPKVKTVNGSVNLQIKAKVGVVTTVNGSIHLASQAEVGVAKTVNGDIVLGKKAKVSGRAVTVNGAVILAASSVVQGRLTNVNGRIEIDGANVGGGIITVNGDIRIKGDAIVDGGIEVENPNRDPDAETFLKLHFDNNRNREPRIVIEAGSSVNGPLLFKKPVKLYVSDKAKVVGPISGTEPIKFTGAVPPVD